MSRSPSAPTRSLPARPSLAQLKKQAKELLNAFRAGDPATIAEVALFELRPDHARFSLLDAQRVLARAYGFGSWTKLRQHVEGIHAAAFCAAVEAGDVAAVRKLAKARPELVSVEWTGAYWSSALQFAVAQRNSDMTRALMELGADARAGTWPHRSATMASAIAKDRGYNEIVAIIEREEERRRRALSAQGATLNSQTDEVLKAILQDQCDDAIRLLESDLSLVGACSLRGATPLHVAACALNPEMIAWLLDHGANVNAEAPYDLPYGYSEATATGKTPLDYAAIVAGWSSHGRHFTFMETAHKPPAVFDETVRILRDRGARLTPRAAVAIGDQQAVRQMHDAGQLSNEVHTLRGGLLSIAVRVNRPEMVSLLLDLGLDPDETVPGDEGRRMSWGMPLWFAALCGRHEIAELLLSRGADVNAIVSASGDPLGIAFDTHDDRMIELLRRHGARLTVEQVAGEGDVKTAQAILDGAIPAGSLNVDDPSPADLAEQMLWAAGGRVEIVRVCLPHITRKHDDPWWNYVLLHAVDPAGFKLVLDHGVDPDVVGGGGYTLLHHLASDYANEETRVIRATLLLDAGASLEKRDPLLKSTPLGWACRWGRMALVELYLSRGADVAEPDAEAWARPLAWAEKGGQGEIVEVLLGRGAEP
jgi:ankyrin repeat protein